MAESGAEESISTTQSDSFIDWCSNKRPLCDREEHARTPKMSAMASPFQVPVEPKASVDVDADPAEEPQGTVSVNML